MNELPTARTIFLSDLLSRVLRRSSDQDRATTLELRDRRAAELARDCLARQLDPSDAPQVLVLDLAGVTFTPSALQELILPLAQRIRGGEHGMLHLVISTTDAGVGDFIRYMAHVHQLPLYLSDSPFELRESTPVGLLTKTETSTLDTINMLGGQVTASRLAVTEGIKPSAAANRLANLDREGYLIRQQRGRREGDLYIEPRSVTATPMVLKERFAVSESGTGPGKPVGSTVTGESQS